MKKKIYCTIIVTILMFLGIGVLEGTCKQQVVYAEETANEKNDVTIQVSYSDFLIKGSDGSYAKVKDEKKQEGDIDIVYKSEIAEATGGVGDALWRIEFEVFDLKSDVNYSIIPDDSEKEWGIYDTFILFFDDAGKEGYGYSIYSKSCIEVTFSKNERITAKTKDGKKADQRIYYIDNRVLSGMEVTTLNVIDSENSIQVKEGKLYIQSKAEIPFSLKLDNLDERVTFLNLKSSDGMFIVGRDGEEFYVTDGEGKELTRKSWDTGYRVYFESGSEEYIDGLVDVQKGSKIEEPKLKARDGYRFDGWYEYDSGKFLEENKWDFSKDVVDETMTLVAKWTKIEKPEKVKLQSVKKAGAGKAKVTWKKQKGVTGYQVIYSTTKKFTKAKIKYVTVSGGKSNVTLKKLKKGKTYYVKVRAYKKNGNSKLYGKYSVVKKIKMKA